METLLSFFNAPAPSWNNLSNHMNAKVRSHVLNVYGHLTQMLVVSSLSAYAFLTNRIPEFLASSPLLALVGTIGLGFYFTSPAKEWNRKLWSFGFAAFKGVALGPLLALSFYIDPQIVFTTLTSTAVIFATFSLSVLMTPSFQFMYVGGLLGSSLSILGWLSIINFFVGSSTLFSIELYLGLLAFSVFIIYDTQVMVVKAEQGSGDYLQHAMELYTDIIAIFVRILVILQKREVEKENDRRRKRR